MKYIYVVNFTTTDTYTNVENKNKRIRKENHTWKVNLTGKRNPYVAEETFYGKKKCDMERGHLIWKEETLYGKKTPYRDTTNLRFAAMGGAVSRLDLWLYGVRNTSSRLCSS